MSRFDGLLYARQAAALLADGWMGPYNSTAMAKVPGYQLFTAVSTGMGIPVKDAEQLVVIAAALSVALCILLVTKRLAWALGAFVFGALDPSSSAARPATSSVTPSSPPSRSS
ncbi:hypothetical protein [Blastococcus brunescens]|uniref:Uncharacterized protein n=1 Tax=Blastococcus brunescens TaxID=1564165 RepID=A0ABZ1AWH7_9ACTN|nr:hypothetical protein [Blastococcus sp. BMG 8361]WRL62923.1 hypothetical protein U6N30_24120 [Blastococcus sp. BMG 8361]